jgi:hypothetical protein
MHELFVPRIVAGECNRTHKRLRAKLAQPRNVEAQRGPMERLVCAQPAPSQLTQPKLYVWTATPELRERLVSAHGAQSVTRGNSLLPQAVRKWRQG